MQAQETGLIISLMALARSNADPPVPSCAHSPGGQRHQRDDHSCLICLHAISLVAQVFEGLMHSLFGVADQTSDALVSWERFIGFVERCGRKLLLEQPLRVWCRQT